jgi:hypothetical protein
MNMDRNQLIEKFLEAETSPQEERLLAESFEATPPQNARERNVAALLGAVKPLAVRPDDEEAVEAFDRILRRSRRQSIRRWSIPAFGVAAALAAFSVLRRPAETPIPENPPISIWEQLRLFTDLNPAEAEHLEFQSAGEGFIMTASFQDGSTASYLLTPMEGESSYCLVSLNE